MEPMAIIPLRSDHPFSQMFVRLHPGANATATIAFIEETLKEYTPKPMDVRFMSDAAADLYDKEQKLSKLTTLFSLLIVFISVVGVFGLVIFETYSRRREIGIRRVYGSTVTRILYLFNRTYIKIVLLCFVVAVPIAWYTLHSWLESFVYRMTVSPWIFFAALAFILGIVAVTVTFQTWRAANENPVNSIKGE